MRPVFAFGRAKLAVVPAALLLFALGPLPNDAALAQADRPPAPEARGADDEFAKQLAELKKTFGDLSKKIDDSAQSMGKLGSAEAARKEIEELRGYVGALLGAVADNGTVWNLGAQALKHAEDKLKALEQETRYRPEDRQFLIERWRALKTATEGNIRDLEKARKDFAELLRTLQTSEDFIDELLQVREHEKALEVIQKLTDGIRDASDKLKKLLSSMKQPGT
jgi:DNA repair exonuclease SbcCD ATPase subunit